MRLIDADAFFENYPELAIEPYINAPTIKTFTLLDIEEQYRKGLEKGLSEWETERPQGEWKLHGMIYYCSECGHDCEQGGNNFCGNCGADMRGKEE